MINQQVLTLAFKKVTFTLSCVTYRFLCGWAWCNIRLAELWVCLCVHSMSVDSVLQRENHTYPLDQKVCLYENAENTFFFIWLYTWEPRFKFSGDKVKAWMPTLSLKRKKKNQQSLPEHQKSSVFIITLPAAAESIVCLRLTKLQKWCELSSLCSRDKDKKKGKKSCTL